MALLSRAGGSAVTGYMGHAPPSCFLFVFFFFSLFSLPLSMSCPGGSVADVMGREVSWHLLGSVVVAFSWLLLGSVVAFSWQCGLYS